MGWEQKQLAPKEGAQLHGHCERQEEKSFPARLSKGLRVGGEGAGKKGGPQKTPGHLRAVLCGSGQPVSERPHGRDKEHLVAICVT